MSLRDNPVIACIGLGANLRSAHGDAPETLAWAVQAIAAYPATQVLRHSSLYVSAPVDADGPDFFNAVVEVFTYQPPLVLLSLLQKTEHDAGRERPYQNAPRTLDLDLLTYGGAQIDTLTLTVPHPRIADRAFVLQPLAELYPHQPQWQAALRQPQVQLQRVEATQHPAWR